MANEEVQVSTQSTPATPAVESTPSTPATAPVTAPTTPGAPSVSTTTNATVSNDDRNGWVPSYRIREAREQAQRQANEQFAQREAQIRSEAENYRRQVLALTGVQQPQNPEIDNVKSQFRQIYPGLDKMEAQAARLEQLLERQGDIEAQTNHYWSTYGRQTMDRLFTHASETMGAPITDEAKRVLHSAFTGFVQSSPEMTERYSSDPSIVEDFWKAFSSSFIDPARRTATVTATGRAATSLPQDTPSGAPRGTPAPQLNGLDERANAAWALYNTHKG